MALGLVNGYFQHLNLMVQHARGTVTEIRTLAYPNQFYWQEVALRKEKPEGKDPFHIEG